MNSISPADSVQFPLHSHTPPNDIHSSSSTIDSLCLPHLISSTTSSSSQSSSLSGRVSPRQNETLEEKLNYFKERTNCKYSNTEGIIAFNISKINVEQDYINFISLFPELAQSLNDHTIRINVTPGSDVSFEILKNVLILAGKNLHTLKLKGINFNDDKISTLLNNCEKIYRLKIESCYIKSVCFRTLNRFPGLQSLTVSHCPAISTLVLPETLSSLQFLEVIDCNLLQSLSLSTLSKLQKFTISACKSLFTLVLPETLPDLQFLSISGCNSLPTLSLPETLSNLQTLVVSHCNSLPTLTLPKTLSNLQTLIVGNCNSLRGLVLPETFSNLQFLRVWGCSILSTLTLPETLSNLQTLIVDDCPFLHTLNFSTLSSLQSLKVWDCFSLRSLVLPETPSNLQSLKVWYCNSLHTLTFSQAHLQSLRTLKINFEMVHFSEELFQNLFNHYKKTTKTSEIDRGVRLFSRKLGEDHRYTQLLIEHLILNSQSITDPNNPYKLHRDLLIKEEQKIEHRPQGHSYRETTFNINVDWIQKPTQIKIIPFSYATFYGMVLSLEEKITINKNALTEYNEIVNTTSSDSRTEHLSFQQLKNDISADFYQMLLDKESDRSSGAASSSSSSSAPLPIDSKKYSAASYRLRTILTYIQGQNENGPTDSLSEGDRTLIQLLLNVRTCPAGKQVGLDTTFYGISEQKTYSQAEGESRAILDHLTHFINEELRRRRYHEFTKHGTHDATYYRNLLGRELGLLAEGEGPHFDRHINSTSQAVRNITKQEALNEFYFRYRTEQIVKWMHELFNNAEHIQIGGSTYEKWLVISQTLNDTQAGDIDAKVFDPRYILHEVQYGLEVPVVVTRYAVALILHKLGIFTALAE